MALRERNGHRDLSYSLWHRTAAAPSSAYSDVDGLEYCPTCFAPLMIVSTTIDVGQEMKSYAPELGLAKQATHDGKTLPLVMVAYGLAHAPRCRCIDDKACEVVSIRWRGLYPTKTDWTSAGLDEWAAIIDGWHDEHRKSCPG